MNIRNIIPTPNFNPQEDMRQKNENMNLASFQLNQTQFLIFHESLK
jgi:hypothetical protein